jgi:hypothetical protein
MSCMQAYIAFTGLVETEAATEQGVAETAEELLGDIDGALAAWRAISEPLGLTVRLRGRVYHKDGSPWLEPKAKDDV